MVAGALTGHAGGASIRSVILANSTLVYLLLLPLAIANLEIENRATWRCWWQGPSRSRSSRPASVSWRSPGHFGSATVEGTSTTLTYYEPTANWLIMVTIFGLLAMLLIGARPPRWALLGSPLLIASLVLSYRRSFWIAGLLGLVLVVILASSLNSRRMLLPIALLIAAAMLGLGTTNLQSSGSPIVRRAASILPSKIEASREDRYRLDERANVLGAIDEHPLTGLGVAVPWSADFAPLSVEHPNGREYVHFAALWYWLKLGILGLIAYVGILLASGLLAWRVWQGAIEPWARAYGLATLCALVGLAVIETTASFTGVDIRFTALLSVQLGVLMQMARGLATPIETPRLSHGPGDPQSRRMIWLSRRGCSDEGGVKTAQRQCADRGRATRHEAGDRIGFGALHVEEPKAGRCPGVHRSGERGAARAADAKCEEVDFARCQPARTHSCDGRQVDRQGERGIGFADDEPAGTGGAQRVADPAPVVALVSRNRVGGRDHRQRDETQPDSDRQPRAGGPGGGQAQRQERGDWNPDEDHVSPIEDVDDVDRRQHQWQRYAGDGEHGHVPSGSSFALPAPAQKQCGGAAASSAGEHGREDLDRAVEADQELLDRLGQPRRERGPFDPAHVAVGELAQRQRHERQSHDRDRRDGRSRPPPTKAHRKDQHLGDRAGRPRSSGSGEPGSTPPPRTRGAARWALPAHAASRRPSPRPAGSAARRREPPASSSTSARSRP